MAMRINLRSPAAQKWIIVGMLAFGMIYGYVNYIYMPKREQAKKLAADIEQEGQLLAKGKRVAANFQRVQDDYARLMESWEVAHELLPTEREMEDLLKSITLEGQKRDVSFLLFRPLEPIEKPYYFENPIQIKTLSTYHDLGEFLSAVASLDRIVNINGVKLSAFRPNKGRSPYTVEAEFTASIYIFKELGTPATVTAVDQKGKKAKPQPAEGEGEPAPAKPAKPAPEKGAKA